MLHFFLSLAVAGSLWGQTLACATSQIALTTADLIDRSEHVVLARCTATKFESSGSGLLGSTAYFHFEVEEVIKGNPPTTGNALVVRLGGQGEAGAPFAQGERVILFLGVTNEDSYPTLYGSEQNVLRIGDLGASFPHPALQGRAVVKGGVSGLDGAPTDPAQAVSMPLDKFLRAARKQASSEKRSQP